MIIYTVLGTFNFLSCSGVPRSVVPINIMDVTFNWGSRFIARWLLQDENMSQTENDNLISTLI